jgi:lipopolysaccharide export system protein LptA
MKNILMLFGLCALSLLAEEVKIMADAFEGDEKKGITTFVGNVKITKGGDELNASKVTVLTDKDRNPYRYEAQGNVSFFIDMSENNATYKGDAQRVVYLPLKQEYQFYTNVHLYQLETNRKIFGEEVILNAKDANAKAIGKAKSPVIMIFNIDDKNKNENKND